MPAPFRSEFETTCRSRWSAPSRRPPTILDRSGGRSIGLSVHRSRSILITLLLIAWAILLPAAAAQAQIEITQAVPFEGPAGTTVPDTPPVTNCAGTPDFSPRFGTTATPFTGNSWVSFHENPDVDRREPETFSIEIDRTLVPGTSYIYRFMTRIAPIDPSSGENSWQSANGGRNSGSFVIYGGNAPCARTRVLGTVNLTWPQDDAWSFRSITFTAAGAYTHFTYRAFAVADDSERTYMGMDDPNPASAELLITKTSSPKPAVAGGPLTYTITVRNNGPSAANGARVQDAVPPPLAGFTWTCAQPVGACSVPAGTGNIDTLVSLAPGQQATFTLQGTLASDHVGTITNTATVAPPPGLIAVCPTGLPNCRQATDENAPVQQSTLTIAKAANPNPATPGGPLTFTVAVQNNGPSVAQNVRIQDPLPPAVAGFAWSCNSPAGGCGSGTGNIDTTVPVLAVGATATITVTGTLAPNQVDAITNIATVIPPPNTTCVPSCQAGVTVPLDPRSAIVVAKTSAPKPAVPGTPLTYTITARNDGPSVASTVRVQDTVPAPLAGFTWTCASPSGACSVPSGTGNIDTTVTNLGVGQTVTVTLTGTLAANHFDAIDNTAIITGGDCDPNCPVPDRNIPDPRSAIVVAKTSAPKPAVPGTPLTYTITARNDGPSVASTVRVQDTVPAPLAGFTWTCASPSGACSVPSGTGNIDTTVTNLGVGQTVTVTLTGTLAANHFDAIDNTAIITGGDCDPNCPVPDRNIPDPRSAIVVAKTSAPKPAVPGTPLTYTITARNDGPSVASTVRVQDTVPAPLAGFTWTCASPSGACSVPSGTGNIDTTVTNLGVGQTVTVTLTGTLAANQFDTITNTAHVTPPEGDSCTPTCDPPDENKPRPRFELTVTKISTPNPAVPGRPITYTITVLNNGPSAVVGARVEDTLSGQITDAVWTCVQPTGACSVPNGTGSVDTKVDLMPGETATITLNGNVPPDATGTLTNRVIVTPPPDTDTTCPPERPDCTTDTDENPLDPQVDIAVTQVVDKPSPEVGQRVTFTVTARNLGPSDASDVALQDLVPEGLLLIGAAPSVGTFDRTTGAWHVGAFAAEVRTVGPAIAGAAVGPLTLQIVAVVSRVGSFTNPAEVMTATPEDIDATNNRATATVAAGGADVEATRLWWLYNREMDTLDFYVDITNVAGRPTSGPITVMIPLPEGLTLHMAPGDWTCEVLSATNTAACTRSDLVLQPNEQITLPLWAEGEVPTDATVYAHVTYAPDINATNNVAQLWPCCAGVERHAMPPTETATLRVPSIAPVVDAVALPVEETVDLVITQQATSVTMAGARRRLSYTVRIENGGPRYARALDVTDVVPPDATLVSASTSTGTCVTGERAVACQWTRGLGPGEAVEISVTLESALVGLLTHTVSVSAIDPDGTLANNQTALTTELIPDAAMDGDADGLPTAWEESMGLDPAKSDAGEDPDGDGVSNLDEYLNGTHARGFFTRYFAEGVTNAFFATELAVVNANAASPATVVLTAQRDDGFTVSQTHHLGPLSRYQVAGSELLQAGGSFSTVIESDVAVGADRILSWDGRQYGSAAEVSLAAPSPTWHFAEGATHGFGLYYLLQNPDPVATAQVEIAYLLPAGAPIVKTYSVAPHSRMTIPVHEIAGLAATDVSATIVSLTGVPIVAERAMYRDAPGQPLAAGHASAGAPKPETTWFFAEGATGAFFDLYLPIANPGDVAAEVTARYQLPDGTTFTKTYVVAPKTRLTIGVEGEDPRLAATAVAITLTSTQPIVAERVMWWPGPAFSPTWYEAHDSLGATTTGTKWAIAGGSVGGPHADSTFVLIANQATTAGSATLTVVFDDGTHVEKTFALAPTSRLTVDVGGEFPTTAGRSFSVIVESLGGTPAPLVVECARYASPEGVLWGSGAAALATKLQ